MIYRLLSQPADKLSKLRPLVEPGISRVVLQTQVNNSVISVVRVTASRLNRWKLDKVLTHGWERQKLSLQLSTGRECY